VSGSCLDHGTRKSTVNRDLFIDATSLLWQCRDRIKGETEMTINQTIQIARGHGISGAYARVMSGAIRAAASDRAVRAFRAAIADDMAAHLFDGLDTSCPTAKVTK
jgi:hypothetical protein